MKGKKKYIATGLLAGLAAGAGAGFVLEQSGVAGAAGGVSSAALAVTDPSGESDSSTSDSTTGDSTTSETPPDAPRLEDALQPLVDDGTLTQAQADAVIAAIQAARPLHGVRAVLLDTVATALGMSEDDVRAALQSGSTIREIATAAGVDPQVVVDAVVAEA